MDANTMQDLDSGMWAEIVPAHCPCRGFGWLTSDFDTEHRCPVHGQGVPHREDDERSAEFDWDMHSLRIHRAAWRALARRAEMDLKPFYKAVVAFLQKAQAPRPTTPKDWVTVASEVAEGVWRENIETKARSMGYSCRLEASLAEAAREEASARREGRRTNLWPSEWH
jgi:hypothetical protein